MWGSPDGTAGKSVPASCARRPTASIEPRRPIGRNTARNEDAPEHRRRAPALSGAFDRMADALPEDASELIHRRRDVEVGPHHGCHHDAVEMHRDEERGALGVDALEDAAGDTLADACG